MNIKIISIKNRKDLVLKYAIVIQSNENLIVILHLL